MAQNWLPRWFVAALRCALSAVTLGGIVLVLDPQRYRETLSALSGRRLLQAAGVSVVICLLRVVRWRFLASRGKPGLGWRVTVRSYVGGFAVSPTAHPWHARIRSARELGGEKRTGLGGLGMLDGIMEAVVVLGALLIHSFAMSAVYALVGAFMLFVVMLREIRRKQWTSQGRQQQLARALAKTSLADLLCVLGISVMVYFAVLFQFHLLFLASGVSCVDCAASILPGVLVASLVPAGIAGIGLPELVAAVGLSRHRLAVQGSLAAFALLLLHRVLPWAAVRSWTVLTRPARMEHA